MLCFARACRGKIARSVLTEQLCSHDGEIHNGSNLNEYKTAKKY